MGNKKKDLYKHRSIYRRQYGFIPPNWEIHHIDGNHSNNEIENLIALPKSVHALVHKISRKHSSPLTKRQDLIPYLTQYENRLKKISELELEIKNHTVEIKKLLAKVKILKRSF